jgi:hypothetical protein
MADKCPISVFRQLYYICALNSIKKTGYPLTAVWKLCGKRDCMYLPLAINETLFSVCRKEQLIWRLKKGYHMSSYSPDLYSFWTQKFCPGGIFKFVEKFGVFDYLSFLKAFAYFNFAENAKIYSNTF